MKQDFYEIVSNERIAPSVYRMVLSGDTSPITAPGQFVNIKIPELYLRRPISICDWDDKALTLIYKTVGEGTEALSRMKPGGRLDLLIALGTRFDDRITGVVSKFAPNAKIIHLDIDISEQNKNVKVDLSVCSDVASALDKLLAAAKKLSKKPDFSEWIGQISQWKKVHPYPFGRHNRKNITSQEAIAELYRVSKGDVIVTTGVGQHQMWTPQNFIFSKPRQFISSLGAGTMGFGLPAAIGVKVANPKAKVVDIDGDGSFQMNIQEMATAVMENIPVKAMILNNQFLGMVMQWEDMLYGGTRGNTVLSRDPNNMGGPENIDAIYPDYCKIAEGYDWACERVWKKSELPAAIDRMLKSDKPYLLEVIVEHDEHVLPFIPPGKSADEIIVECSSCPNAPTCDIKK